MCNGVCCVTSGRRALRFGRELPGERRYGGTTLSLGEGEGVRFGSQPSGRWSAARRWMSDRRRRTAGLAPPVGLPDQIRALVCVSWRARSGESSLLSLAAFRALLPSARGPGRRRKSRFRSDPESSCPARAGSWKEVSLIARQILSSTAFVWQLDESLVAVMSTVDLFEFCPSEVGLMETARGFSLLPRTHA